MRDRFSSRSCGVGAISQGDFLVRICKLDWTIRYRGQFEMVYKVLRVCVCVYLCLLQYLPHLTPYGPFKKAAAGYRNTVLLNTKGQVILMGTTYIHVHVHAYSMYMYVHVHVLLCLVCLFDLACFFLTSFSSLI